MKFSKSCNKEHFDTFIPELCGKEENMLFTLNFDSVIYYFNISDNLSNKSFIGILYNNKIKNRV